MFRPKTKIIDQVENKYELNDEEDLGKGMNEKVYGGTLFYNDNQS
jgi:predicted Ser/Thr protein kinase